MKALLIFATASTAVRKMVAAPLRSRAAIFAGYAGLLASCTMLMACGSSGSTYTSPSTLPKCSVTVDTPGSSLPAVGGSAALAVKTERECQWNAQPDVGWLNITDGSSGQGNGSIRFSATANGDPVPRTGGIMVNGLRAQVSQAAGECGFELGSRSGSFPPAGGTGSVDVRASSALCTWTAASNASWVAITSGANGKGTAPVAFNVESTTGPPRTATLTIAGLHYSITQSEGCTYAIAPTTYSAGAAGGTTVVTVTAGVGCPWSVSSEVPWISTTASSGSGNGTVGLTVASVSGPARTGTVSIAGQVFTVTQSANCTFDVSPLTLAVDAGGGTRTVNVSAGGGCTWSANSNADWITITGGSSGDGAGTVTFAVAPTGGPSRSETMTVAGQTVTVTQGQGCTYAISPDSQSVASAGGSGTVNVTAGAGCTWTASSNAVWLKITSGASGGGNGKVSYTVAPNTGAERTGTITAGGLTFSVKQDAGCSYSISPDSMTVSAAGGSGSFAVNAGGTCAWTATATASWISITSGANGAGTGTVQFTVAANTAASRTGTITVAGQTFTVLQDAGCTFTVAPETIAIPASGGSQNVSINTREECSWTAVGNVSWIAIQTGASGVGNGVAQLDIQANTGPARSGTATVAGRTVTVNQDGGCTYALVPSSQPVPAAGGSGSFKVSAAEGCPWTAASTVPWITLASGGSGSGEGTVQFTVDANATGAPRSGTITVADQTFTVSQAGADDHP